MPDFSSGLTFRLPRGLRISGCVLLIGLLFSATLYNEEIYTVFGNFWQQLLATAVVAQHSPAQLQTGGVMGQLTHRPRNISAVITYSVLYTGTCLVLLFLLLPDPMQRRLVLLAYSSAGAMLVLLSVGSWLGSEVLATFSAQLAHFIVSPLPVIILAPLLWWYLPSKRLSSYKK
ncbi:MAG: hypothetical protein EOO61_00505 [Hymenobacter sp.]|nr:MAG: hypothetical protein EOO61_00505 [Hymenobacter sp.]